MNTRELTVSESEKTTILKESSIDYELVFLTDTGLNN